MAEADFIKLKLTIAYDGRQYEGWQVQKTGTGVQEVIQQALRKIFPNARPLHGSSRTDTGVHALAMIAHTEIPRREFRMTFAKVTLALNAHLPEDIRVIRASRAARNFHARFDARGKQYRYFVWNAPAMNPLLRHQAWHVPRPLHLEAMQRAARLLKGTHDFEAFAGVRPYKSKSTVRTVTRFDVVRRGPLLTFIIEGDGFLYKMCRTMVGTLVQIGLRKFEPDETARMLKSKDRRLSGMTAPAHGLILWQVFYRARNSRNRGSAGHGEDSP